MISELLTGLCQALTSGLGAQFQVRQRGLQVTCLLPCGGELFEPALAFCFGLALGAEPGLLFGREVFPCGRGITPGLSKPLELLLQRLFLLLKFSLTTRTLGEPAVQFATQPGEFFFGATMGGFQLVAPRLKAGEVCRVLGLLFGESPLSVCQFFRPAPKLFLQRFADLLDF